VCPLPCEGGTAQVLPSRQATLHFAICYPVIDDARCSSIYLLSTASSVSVCMWCSLECNCRLLGCSSNEIVPIYSADGVTLGRSQHQHLATVVATTADDDGCNGWASDAFDELRRTTNCSSVSSSPVSTAAAAAAVVAVADDVGLDSSVPSRTSCLAPLLRPRPKPRPRPRP